MWNIHGRVMDLPFVSPVLMQNAFVFHSASTQWVSRGARVCVCTNTSTANNGGRFFFVRSTFAIFIPPQFCARVHPSRLRLCLGCVAGGWLAIFGNPPPTAPSFQKNKFSLSLLLLREWESLIWLSSSHLVHPSRSSNCNNATVGFSNAARTPFNFCCCFKNKIKNDAPWPDCRCAAAPVAGASCICAIACLAIPLFCRGAAGIWDGDVAALVATVVDYAHRSASCCSVAALPRTARHHHQRQSDGTHSDDGDAELTRRTGATKLPINATTAAAAAAAAATAAQEQAYVSILE